MASTEQNFPRGGYTTNKKDENRIAPAHIANNSDSEMLIGENSKETKKTHKMIQSNTSINLAPFSLSDIIVPDYVDTLNYHKITDGMLLLGCVNYVSRINGIGVQLPGRCYGKIKNQNISNEYTKHGIKAKQRPQATAQVGDFVPVKVLSKVTESNGFHLSLSAKPEDVNANICFNKFSLGMLIWASIIERSDHCYNLNVGVPNCRVVLPFKKAGAYYYIGQNIWCAIQRANIQDNSSILTVSTINEDMQNVSVKNNTSLDVLTPGMTVIFEVEKVLKNGLRGSICQNNTSFIETTNLVKIKDYPQNYKFAQKLFATLLYVQPATKFSYFTLQSISNDVLPIVKLGTKLNAKVLARKNKGICILLESADRGFIPFKRLQIRKILNTEVDDAETLTEHVIVETYPNNRTIHVRVIDYNYIERTYICTNQTDVMDEKYFSMSDFKIGDIVMGNIKQIKHNGIVLSIGRINGFIKNLHLCDILFTDNIKKKFAVNQNIKAKVLNVISNNVYLTLKQSLINSVVNLSSVDQIDIRINYPGVIMKISKNIIHVQFYGNLCGTLNLSGFKDQHNIAAMFYIGQVIKTSISKIEGYTPILTLSSNVDNVDLNDVNQIMISETKGKKRTLCESTVNNENMKKAKVEAANTDSTDINDSDDCKMDIEKELQPILKRKKNRKRKSISFVETPQVKTFNKSSRADPTAISCIKPLAIRGVSDFFDNTTLRLNSDSDSDEEEIVVEPEKKVKKSPKQAAAERRETRRLEEERLRAIEIQLADSSALPQSAELFDRSLVGQPNSSKLWAQYIAFYIQSMEIEKARTTARRALQTINLTESQERINIWTIFLNLEHEYGSKDSYDEIFNEAIICNNSFPIYLLALEHNIVKGESIEAGNIWTKLKREHKNNIQMWIKVGKIYYENKRYDEARKLRDDGLKTITDKSMQIGLIIKFAIFEFTYGESSQGETLFETIIQSDPKRVIVWSTYVDQLVKKNNIDLARRVLNRAVSNKIPFKKMKFLFKKYYQFEKAHGDAETLAYVEALAKEYAFSVSAL